VAQFTTLGHMTRLTQWSVTAKLTLGLVAVLVLMFVLVVAAYTSLHDHTFNPRQFDSQSWKQGDLRMRGEMVESLQSQALLRNKSRDEVLALIGKPDEDRGYQLRYEVDVGRRIAWSRFCEILVVTLDEKQNVDRVERVD